MTQTQQRNAARQFALAWKGRGDESRDDRSFWLQLFSDVFGVENPFAMVEFQKPVRMESSTRFIDAYIPGTKVIIEQKGIEVDLARKLSKSGGAMLTPYEQARRYDNNLPASERPRWIVCCNFRSFEIHDMDRPLDPPEVILLENLERDYARLAFLVGDEKKHIEREKDLSISAGALVGRLYDLLLPQYVNPESPETLKSLNKLCVRLVFCLYAEDSGMFGAPDAFYRYLTSFRTENVRTALIELFKTLDTKPEDRDPYMPENLAAFPYANGGLFRGEIEIPRLTEEITDLLLNGMSLGFDWSGISPTIFGAVFESTLNPETRRSGGMHYTSIENIHKVIDPLFLDGLREELGEILNIKVSAPRRRALVDFWDRLASLTFLDPACGSGNFLTETYISIRRMENRIVQAIYGREQLLGRDFSPIRTGINQFYGIEVNDFAVTVAMTALWIAEAQMKRETESIVGYDIDFFPLETNPNIVEANALRLDWGTLCPSGGPDYIMGNPPFIGARLMSQEQKDDLLGVFGPKWKNLGNLDYVSGWYKKAADLMETAGGNVRTALVSTNSICQGESVAALWKPLTESGVHIDFAYRTFRWDSEASQKAHVHCVIVGFSAEEIPDTGSRTADGNDACGTAGSRLADGKDARLSSGRAIAGENGTRLPAGRFIVDEKGVRRPAGHINAYLLDSPDVFIESRTKPICDVPPIGIGNKPIDGGFYLFSEEERDEFIRKEPASERWFRPFYGSFEFINRKPRYCLWLGECPPNVLRSMPECLKRVQAVRDYRLASPSAGTVKLADRPTRFHVENIPDSDYIVVPSVSSEKRDYVPMGFLSQNDLSSNLVLIIPSATLFHFGVLESSVHMAWMRAVCGRLKSDYRYSKDIVYNNFPWPSCTPEYSNPSHSSSSVVTAQHTAPAMATDNGHPEGGSLNNDTAKTAAGDNPGNSSLNSSAAKTGECEPDGNSADYAARQMIQRIEQTARAILDARDLYPEATLADLYDPLTMPPELRKAHKDNDNAVLAAYGFPATATEPETVSLLFALHRQHCGR